MDGCGEKLSGLRFCVGRYFVYSQWSPVITSVARSEGLEPSAAVMPGYALFSVWIFRPGHREDNVSAKSARHAGTLHPRRLSRGRRFLPKRPVLLEQTHSRKPEPGSGSLRPGHCVRSQLLRCLRRRGQVLQPAARVLGMPGNEAYFKAFAAAKKAVELDPQSSEAHASLAFVTF